MVQTEYRKSFFAILKPYFCLLGIICDSLSSQRITFLSYQDPVALARSWLEQERVSAKSFAFLRLFHICPFVIAHSAYDHRLFHHTALKQQYSKQTISFPYDYTKQHRYRLLHQRKTQSLQSTIHDY